MHRGLHLLTSAVLSACLAMLLGCDSERPASTPDANKALPAIDVSVEPVDEAGFDKVISQLRGKVVVVDFWQTTCDTCRYEFPKLVQLHSRHAGDSVATVSMNLDDPKNPDVDQKVRHFLQQHKADFTNLRLASGQNPVEWIQKHLHLTEGLPGQRVYDRHGKLVQTFSGGDDYPDIETLVNRLLKQP